MGCSIECKLKSDKRLSFSIASKGENAPLASTLSSIVSTSYSFLMALIKDSSVSKSIAPILIFKQSKPASILDRIWDFINCSSPIHISPFIGIDALPDVNFEGNKTLEESDSKSKKAISKPN